MEKDLWKIEELAWRKSFRELTEDEKAFVLLALESEEEYEALRKVEQTLAKRERKAAPASRPGELASLQALLRRTHRRSWTAVFTLSVPAYATILLVVLAVLSTAWLASGVQESQNSVVTVPARVDTVIVTRVDTVYREKTIMRTVLATSIQPCVEKKVMKSDASRESPKGVSMKDNEELDKLLVSGTER